MLDNFDPLGSLLAMMLKYPHTSRIQSGANHSISSKEDGFSERRITGWCSMDSEQEEMASENYSGD